MPYSKEILDQLAHPSGNIGKEVLNRLNLVNANINRLTLEALRVRGDERILEVGFGGGALIAELLASGPGLRVVGAEVSWLAVQTARQNFRGTGHAHRAHFLPIDESRFPFEDGSFDKVASVNVVYFLSDLEREFREVFRILRPGGLCVLSYAAGAPDGVTRFLPDRIERTLLGAGFETAVSDEASDEENGVFYCTSAETRFRKPVDLAAHALRAIPMGRG